MTTPHDIERRVNELEVDDEVERLTVSHLIADPNADEDEQMHLVDEERGIWFCPSTDDLRRGPTVQEVERNGGFLEAVVNDAITTGGEP